MAGKVLERIRAGGDIFIMRRHLFLLIHIGDQSFRIAIEESI